MAPVATDTINCVRDKKSRESKSAFKTPARLRAGRVGMITPGQEGSSGGQHRSQHRDSPEHSCRHMARPFTDRRPTEACLRTGEAREYVYSFRTGFPSIPIPSISISTMSPPCMSPGWPGVPVMMTSPGSRVMTLLTNSIIVGTS